MRETPATNTDWPIPLSNPVTTRRTLLLSRHFQYCVQPSISIGTCSRTPANQGIVKGRSNNSGNAEYPVNMALQRAHSGSRFPLTTSDREGIRWHGIKDRDLILANNPSFIASPLRSRSPANSHNPVWSPPRSRQSRNPRTNTFCVWPDRPPAEKRSVQSRQR